MSLSLSIPFGCNFDATGKALGSGTDNGEIKRDYLYGDGKSDYFIFDNDGYMLSGWKRWSKSEGQSMDGDLYYLGTQDERLGTYQLPVVRDWSWSSAAFDGINTDDEQQLRMSATVLLSRPMVRQLRMIRPNTTTRLIPSMSTEECLICGYIRPTLLLTLNDQLRCIFFRSKRNTIREEEGGRRRKWSGFLLPEHRLW